MNYTKDLANSELKNSIKKYDFSGTRGWIIGFLTTAIFIILKLVKIISWKWIWVFSPIIIVAAVYPILFFLILIAIILFA